MKTNKWLCQLYTVMLRAYPAEFRALYGPEMARVFRESYLDAVRTRKVPRFALRMVKDWMGTVIEERIYSMDINGFRPLRIALALTVAIDLAILAFVIRPAAPPPVVTAMVVPFVLLWMYGLFALLARPGRGAALGFAGGIALTLTSTFGAFDSHGSIALGISVALSLILLFSTAGFRAARSSAEMTAGALAGCWAGLAFALTKVTAGLLLLQIGIPNEASIGGRIAAGWSEPRTMWTPSFLAAAGQHLLFGPTVGLICGLIGGVVGRMRGTPVLEAAK